MFPVSESPMTGRMTQVCIQPTPQCSWRSPSRPSSMAWVARSHKCTWLAHSRWGTLQHWRKLPVAPPFTLMTPLCLSQTWRTPSNVSPLPSTTTSRTGEVMPSWTSLMKRNSPSRYVQGKQKTMFLYNIANKQYPYLIIFLTRGILYLQIMISIIRTTDKSINSSEHYSTLHSWRQSVPSLLSSILKDCSHMLRYALMFIMVVIAFLKPFPRLTLLLDPGKGSLLVLFYWPVRSGMTKLCGM